MQVLTGALHPDFGATVEGIDLGQVLTPEQVAEIDAALETHAVLVFRAQTLSQDRQLEMCKQFGEIDMGLVKARPNTPIRLKHRELLDISNVGYDGEVAERDHAKIVSNIANQLWHSDSSFQNPAARFSMLYGVVVPPDGGETEFVDMRIAYETMPPALKERIQGLSGEHHAFHSRMLLGAYMHEQLDAIPPAVWPLVRRQQRTGRNFVFASVHIREILDMTVAEGRILVSDLIEHATERQRRYSHTWQEGDLVMWDNRITLHRGRHFPLEQRREMRRTTTLDRNSQSEALVA
jgi:alpha-ketoglutarate-dependent 2,4-dichlorophenoxyacetate dioxygenase